MSRITARNIENVVENLLQELKRQELVPADSYAAATRAEPAYGITWDAHVFRELGPRDGQGQVRAGYERVPTVLDRALDGITSTREAWLILDATLRTLRWAAAERKVLAVGTVDAEDRAWNRAHGYPEDTQAEDRDPEDRVLAQHDHHAARGMSVPHECPHCTPALADEDELVTWAVDIATPATSSGYGTTVTREGFATEAEAVRHIIEYLDARTPMSTDVRHRLDAELSLAGSTYHVGYHASLRAED